MIITFIPTTITGNTLFISILFVAIYLSEFCNLILRMLILTVLTLWPFIFKTNLEYGYFHDAFKTKGMVVLYCIIL